MSSLVSCGVPAVMANDPRFQALKEAYKGRHYCDDHLAQALQLCREYHDYSYDWYPETPAQKSVFTRFLNNYLTNAKLAQTESDLSRDSLYNLYTTLYALYTPEQLDSRLNMIARNFRDLVDQLQKKDKGNRTRQEIIQSQATDKQSGFQVLLKKVFDIYEKKYSTAEGWMNVFEKAGSTATEEQKRQIAEYRAEEYRTLVANKERLAALAASRIGEEEGLVVNVNNFRIELEVPTEEQLSEGQLEGNENDGNDAEEGSKGDRFVDFRTLKLMNTLSTRAKRLISRIPKVNSSGNVIRDDLGVVQYVGGRQVASTLKKVLVNSSPDTMMTDLEAAADMYPWINGLISELNKNKDARTTVYDNFKSAETTYIYTTLTDRNYDTKIANTRSAGNALMREAGSNLRAGYVLDEEKSIYVGYGSLKSLEEIKNIHAEFNKLKNLIQSEEGTKYIRMVKGDVSISKKTLDDVISNGSKEGKDLSYLRSAPQDAMKAFLDANPNVPVQLAGFLRGMGFQVSPKDIITAATQEITKKGYKFLVGYNLAKDYRGRNRLYQLVEFMNGVYGRAEEIYKNNLVTTGQYLYNTSGAFTRINRALALAQYKDLESRVVSEGKSLSTYNNMNLLHQTFDLLANRSGMSEENYRDTLETEYLQYEGMSLGYGSQKKAYGWLKMLQENTNHFRENLRVVDISAFNHVEYADLSRAQKLTNGLVQYFDSSKTLQADGFALYEVPIQADYSTAYNFVFAPKLSESEIVEALTDEVLMELERIDSIEKRIKNENRVKLNVYEEQGVKFNIFQAFNNSDLRSRYASTTDPEEARDIIRTQVQEQLKNIVLQDTATIDGSGILSNNALGNIYIGEGKYESFVSQEGKVSGLSETAQQKLREYFLNTFYARQQIVKLVAGGTEQFNGLIDFEKRNMLSHATRSSLYTKATWKGETVGKETQNVAYIEDDESTSAFLDDIKEMLSQLLDKEVITKSQYNTMIRSYSGIKTTDGQGFRTLDSYRTVQIMADQWDDAHEAAYKNIKEGKPTKKDISVFMQNIKPVLTGYEYIPAAVGDNQKPVKLTVLHKYSEAVLLPVELAKYCLQTQSVPLQALDRAQKRLKQQGKEIDMFLFHSGVKVGAHSILNPFAKDKDGNRILNDAKSIEDYIVNGALAKNSVVHELPFKYYGIAASTPAHAADDRIAWASQAEKVAWANIDPNDEKAWNNRELYFAIKTADIVENYQKLRKLFVDADELERIFQEELANKSYSSHELTYALSHLKDGTFALPLFSPNIEHQVQELLASIIKKRLTKPKLKGANILQATGLGMDIEASKFDNTNALSEEDKLHVVFEGSGENKRVKYVEVYMPIHDTRLNIFADKNGNIGPDRLRELVSSGVIPESMLDFIAYRTPSDAEHSVIPCHIKGFVANTGGATIMMPKEIMVMTGHDYDGDKMRCHFKDFKLVDKEGDELNLSDDDITRMVLGQMPVNKNFRKCEVYQYNYDLSPLDNSPKARANARIDLMFAELTSPEGSRRMLIPGGCDETKVIAKTLYLVRKANLPEANDAIRSVLIEQGASAEDSRKAVSNVTNLYNNLIRKSDKQLTSIVRAVSSTESPYTVSHAADAFDYIMGGSQMIGVYATYNSALQMLQRLNMSYVPALTKENKEGKRNPYTVELFGHTFDKLFSVTNHNGRLASLGLARLLNAAVDNNKDPVLGYLNQTKEMAEMTFLLFAAGVTEEEIHLIMNQPAVIELINRLKGRDSSGLSGEIKNIVSELALSDEDLGKISQWEAVDKIKDMTRADFIKNLASSYEDIRSGQDYTAVQQQLYVLQTLAHLAPAANNLSTFVRLTRPESESGAIGTSVSDIIAKTVELNKFRNKLDSSEDNELRISGMREILAKRDVHEGWDTKYLEEIIGDNLPEVVALNSLMIDTSLDMFKPFFPQAKREWVDLAAQIANNYKYKKVQEGIISKVGHEMILWKLLGNKKFVKGDPQEEQRRIIIDVPKQLKDLKERISRAQTNPGKDPAADELVGNAFLDKLTATSPENSNTAPRLQFTVNGSPIEGTADLIRASWGAMLTNPEKGIRDLAVDLFKYNMYTNGFSYGMYEFAHFAPYSILASTPGYIEALQDVLDSNWNDEHDRENFINYYYMNHWGDRKFLRAISVCKLKTTPGTDGRILISNKTDKKILEKLEGERYFIGLSGENNSVQTLYRIVSGSVENGFTIEPATKLGVVNYNQQATLQYNPAVDYDQAQPVVAGNDSVWGELDITEEKAYAWVDVDKIKNQEALAGLGFFGISAPTEEDIRRMSQFQKESEKNVEKNDIPAPTSMGSGLFGALGAGADLSGAVVSVSTEDEEVSSEGKMFSIARRTEDGKIKTEQVPASPEGIREARKQKVYASLNKKLREILREKGVSVGVLTSAEARLNSGVADFDTAPVLAEGLIELIRIAEGYEGEQALPEEFAHVALEMLGHDNPLVQRLLNVLRTNQDALEEAYDGQYAEYEKRYGEDNKEKLVLEAAGKLVSKSLFRHEEIKTKPIKGLLSRIIDAIKSFFRRFRRDQVQNAVFDAYEISSQLARELLGGRLLDQMSITNIASSEQFLKAKKDITDKNDILSKLLKTELKRLAIIKKRLGYKKTSESDVYKATEVQIKKLESAIRNYKTEDAVINYLNDSLDFLKVTNDSLMDSVNSGKPANTVCRKLNSVRDTLYSFSAALDDITEAIRDREIQDTVGLNEAVNKVSGVLQKFYQEYTTIARTYLEEMLSNVYGREGKVVTVGRDKGKLITIHDMATKRDGDISLASRWFNSLADCGDYVLGAIDDLTRNAKLSARKMADAVRPRIEVAMARLEKETGSRDQTFMFEMEVGEDGKKHKTGKYISEEASKSLTPAQKEFYDTMMSIKKDADKYIPETLREDRKIIMMRKYTMDRFKAAEGAKEKALVAWEGLKNRVMDMSDDIDFENYEVAVDFEGNKVDMLPVKFLLKGKKESFDDMSDDVATSMMAYAGMAYEYGHVNGVIGVLENARYMSMERDVIQKAGRRTKRETIKTDNYIFHNPFTKKQLCTNIQNALDDFFQMHIYGHIQKNEGTIGNTRLSKRKVVDTVNAVTSYSQMALNIPQRIANVNTGLTQILLESVGNGAFSVKDVLWASGQYMKMSGDRLAETGKTDYDNKLSLWDEYFDVHQNNGQHDAQYQKGRMSRVFNSSLLYAGLTMGEDYLASTTSLALAKNYKVKDASGKETNLWDAYEVKYLNDTNKTGAYLSLKEGYTKLDGSPITKSDEMTFSKRVAGFNFELQGIYNRDDRSAVQQYAFGSLIIMYRKWIAPSLKRRYGKTQYNLLKDDYQEGYYRTLFRMIGDMIHDTKEQVSEEESAGALARIISDMKALRTSVLLNWKNMTAYEKSNVKRAFTELSVVAGLWLSCTLLGKVPPPDYGDDEPGKILQWWDRTVMSQMLRLRTEIGSQAPTPMMVDEAMHILKSPFAAIQPLQNTINAFQLMLPSNYLTEIKSGKYKGHSKAYKYFRELPIISMFKKVDNFLDPSGLINYYRSDAF